MSAEHRIPLGGTGWWVWRDALLRAPGFPAGGLAAFAAPGCAAAADRALDGAGREPDGEFGKALAAAVAAGSAALVRVAANPLLREAVTWQNPGMLVTLDALVRDGAGAPRNRRRRGREGALMRYWQRYCAKNETIGFFGPACWARVDPAASAAVAVRTGAGLVRERQVWFEHWPLAAYGDRLAAEPAVRRWFPPALPPHLLLEGRAVRRPARPPVPVSAPEAALLAACDGRRPAREVVAAVRAEPALGLRSDEDGFLLLDRLARRGLLEWGARVPVSRDAERILGERITGIGDRGRRDRARAGLARLVAARDAVAAAAGRPDRLRTALAALDHEFTAVTGRPPRRRPGQAYAGRTLCYEDTTRDLDLVVGAPLLAGLAAPLAVVAQVARWVTVALAEVYRRALHDLYRDLRAGARDEVRLADLWYVAAGLFWGTGGERPVDEVAGELQRRWDRLFGLDRAPLDREELRFRAEELAGPARTLFPADRPGWSAGRVHSPDLLLCASDLDALNRGDYLAVLGELHAAHATMDSAVFTRWHPDPDRLAGALRTDLGGTGPRPLYPVDWPRNSGRLTPSEGCWPQDQLGVAPAPGADPSRLVRATAVRLRERDGELVAVAPDGRCWPVVEAFSALLSLHAVDAFRLASPGHRPRLTVDRLVVARRQWRTTVGATGLAPVRDEPSQYLAARAWRRALDLPERVFVRVGTETKPVYADLTSPHCVGALSTLIRAARAGSGDAAPVTVTEMLPTPDQAWLPDAAGRRYLSELRLQLTDPEPAR